MADFKKHISWGAIMGIATVVAGLIFSLVSGFETFIWIFCAVLVGSILPDLDLDEGIPFQIIFGLAAASFAGCIFFNLFRLGESEMFLLVGLPILAFVVIRFGIGFVFMKFTRHRGMFHSIPAAILAGLLAISLLNFFEIKDQIINLLGLALGIGYVCHLVLDEMYSTISFNGIIFRPKKSLGSALKFRSSSRLATAVVYTALIGLLVGFYG